MRIRNVLGKNIDEAKMLANYYKHLLDRNTNNTSGYGILDEKGNILDARSDLYYYIVDMRGFNRFPLQVSHEDYENLKGKKLYHGANMLTHHNYHRGEGISGSGIYIAPDQNEAFKYTKIDNPGKPTEWNRDKILEMKFSGRVIDELTLRRLAIEVSGDMELRTDLMAVEDVDKIKRLRDFVKKNIKDKKQAKSFLRVFYENESLLGIVLGYDATEVYKRDWGTAHLVVFNRGKITVKESEVKRFCEKSTRYQSGAYSFENTEKI